MVEGECVCAKHGGGAPGGQQPGAMALFEFFGQHFVSCKAAPLHERRCCPKHSKLICL